MTIIYLDPSTGAWTDSPNAALDLFASTAVAVKKEYCYFHTNGLVKTDKHLLPDFLDNDPLGVKEMKPLAIKEDRTDEQKAADGDLPPVLDPSLADLGVEENADLEDKFAAAIKVAGKRGRPKGATTKAFPAPWDARAKAVGGQTKLAMYLGCTYKALREIVDGCRECPADMQAKAEFLDKQGA